MYGDSIVTATDINNMIRLRSREAPVPGDEWTDTIDGASFTYKRYDKDPYGSWYAFNDMYSEFGLRYLAWSSQITKDMVVIDAGAQYGAYTLPALAKGATVYAFEPDPFNFQHLMTNIYTNSFQERAKCYQLALFDRTGLIFDWFETQNIKSIRVDDLGLERLDILKIDVEGAELHVLRGAIETIRKFQPTLIVENHIMLNPAIERRVKEYVLNNILPYTYRFFTFNTGNTEFNHTYFFKNEAKQYLVVA